MRTWLWVALAGCGYGEDRFLAQGVDRWCELSAACAGSFTAEACAQVIRSSDRGGCDYDPVAARACWASLPEAVCVEDDALDVRYLDVPAACQAVYACAEG